MVPKILERLCELSADGCRKSMYWGECESVEGAIFSMSPKSNSVSTRETREEWALRTVETEANGDSWSTTHERGPSLVCKFIVGLALPVKEIFPALAA
jgi:hypothetical protein